MMHPAVAAPLVAEIEALLATRGEALAAGEQISTKHTGISQLRTFRLTLASGRQLKARRYDMIETLQRNLDLHACFDIAGIPAPLAHSELLLLEPWLEGQLITAETATQEQLEAAGELLGQLHAQPCPEHLGDRMAGVQARLARLEQRLNEFATCEHLTTHEAESLLHLARTTAPRRNVRGLVHRDFRPENLIWTENGLACIDNDTLDFGPFDEDLARVWLLWPMSETAREEFWRGYARYRDPASFLDHFAFWAIYSSVCCLQFRLQAKTYGWRIPLQRLRELAALNPTASATPTPT